MNIGLVAFRYHSGVLQMYLELCVAAGVRVTLFTSEVILRDLSQYFGEGSVPAARVLLNSGTSDGRFIRRIAAESGGLEALLFVELQYATPSDWRCFRDAGFRCPVAAGVHDLVTEPGLEPLPCWRISARARARLRREAFARIDRFVVHSPRMQARLAQQVAPRKVCFLPVYFRDRSFRRTPRRDDDILRVCIPGVYEYARRDYATALDAAARALDRGCRLHLSMVGHRTHRESALVVAAFRDFRARHEGALTWTPGYSEEAVFRRTLESADILLAALAPPPSGDGPKGRVYALDRHITAATYDAVRFQLPILYPSFYLPAAEQHPGSRVYTSAENLADLLVALASTPARVASLTNEAIRHSESFTPERFAPAFLEFLAR
jgi:hypothetical protein